MRKTLVSMTLVSAVVLSAGVSQAVPVATIRDFVFNPNNYIINLGDGPGPWNFDVIVEISTDVSLVSAQFYIQDLTSSGFITLNSLTWNGALWDASAELNPTPETLNSGNSYTSGDIGTYALDLINGTGTGTFDFVTINITVASGVAPGSLFTLQLTDLIFGDTNFDDAGATAGTDYDIRVLPAPGAVLLGAMGLGLVGWLKRRRHVA